MHVANTILSHTILIYFSGKKIRQRRVLLLVKRYKTLPNEDLCADAISLPTPDDEVRYLRVRHVIILMCVKQQ